MKPEWKYPKYTLWLKIVLWPIGVGITGLVFTWGVVINPPHVREHAKQHSIDNWGSPIHRVLQQTSKVQPNDTGAYRIGIYIFINMYGESQQIDVDFPVNQVPEDITIWQKKSTARVFVAGELMHSVSPEGVEEVTPATPHYGGGMTQFGFIVLGLILTALAGVVCAFILIALFEAVSHVIYIHCRKQQIRNTEPNPEIPQAA
jgi:hypothetical protein